LARSSSAPLCWTALPLQSGTLLIPAATLPLISQAVVFVFPELKHHSLIMVREETEGKGMARFAV